MSKGRGQPRPFSLLHARFKPPEPDADIESVSLTITPPVRLVALVGALVLTGIAAAVFLLSRNAIDGEPSASVPQTPAHTTPASKPTAAKPSPAVKHPTHRRPTGFPTSVDNALRANRIVVVSVFMPNAPVDAIVRRAAREGARAAHARFVGISALNERAVARLVAKTGVLPDPAVVVVKRPGVVMSTFSVTDAGTIAQAVAQARK